MHDADEDGDGVGVGGDDAAIVGLRQVYDLLEDRLRTNHCLPAIGVDDPMATGVEGFAAAQASGGTLAQGCRLG